MTEAEALEIYRLWLAEQQRLEPLIPIRYIAQRYDLSHRQIQDALKILVRLKKAKPIKTGETGLRKRYRMVSDEK